MAGITLKNVCKTFDKKTVVKNLDLEIEDGEFVVLVGPSGCGKSTTLRMIAGLETPTSGEIMIGGKVVNDVPAGKRRHRNGFPELCDLSHHERSRKHRVWSEEQEDP